MAGRRELSAINISHSELYSCVRIVAWQERFVPLGDASTLLLQSVLVVLYPNWAQSCVAWVHYVGGRALCLQHWVPSWSPLLIHFQDKWYLSLFLPELVLSFLVVLVNGDNPRIRRWSRARVKLSLPWEGARKRKKNEVHRRRREELVNPGNPGLLLLLPLVRPKISSIATTAWFSYDLAMIRRPSPY